MKTIVLLLSSAVLFLSCSKDDELVNYVPEKYNAVNLIDIHNHDASGYKYQNSLKTWDEYGVNKIVLFGDISEPSALLTDAIAMDAYKNNPSRFYPFFAGLNIKDSSCIKAAEDNFKKGYFGIGEVVAASTNSPVASKLPWKGNHPMDGYFPEIYKLCEKYKAPILLHIDPPNGYPIEKLKEALAKFPNTVFIFGHANAYNSPANVESLLRDYKNIYMDFFAGFTRYNSGSNYSLEDFAKIIRKYPNRFMVSSDSGFDVGYDKAYLAIYELFDLLDNNTMEMVAHKNFETIIAMRNN